MSQSDEPSRPDGNRPFDMEQGGDGKPPASRSPAEALRRINPYVVLGALAAVVLIVFIAQNTDEVRVNFLGWDWDLPLFLLLLITTVLSVACAEIASWYMGRRRRKH